MHRTDRRLDAAVAMDAKNAPTATWKTAQNAVSHSAHTHDRYLDKRSEQRLTHEIPDSPVSSHGEVPPNPTDRTAPTERNGRNPNEPNANEPNANATEP